MFHTHAKAQSRCHLCWAACLSAAEGILECAHHLWIIFELNINLLVVFRACRIAQRSLDSSSSSNNSDGMLWSWSSCTPKKKDQLCCSVTISFFSVHFLFFFFFCSCIVGRLCHALSAVRTDYYSLCEESAFRKFLISFLEMVFVIVFRSLIQRVTISRIFSSLPFRLSSPVRLISFFDLCPVVSCEK